MAVGDGSGVIVDDGVTVEVGEGTIEGSSVGATEGLDEQAVKINTIAKMITFCFMLFPFRFFMALVVKEAG